MNSEERKELKLSYDIPLDAVFMRILAWEHFVAKRPRTVTELTRREIQAARQELGLRTIQEGSARNFLQSLRARGHLQDNLPIRDWDENKWQLLYLPPHSLSRQLSFEPIVYDDNPKSKDRFFVTLRNPAIPRLYVCLGKGREISEAIRGRRGVYILRLEHSIYIGKTDEFEVRIGDHIKNKNPKWWIFVALDKQDQNLTLDTLNAVEALLISFWNETCELWNDNRGGDRMPAALYLQQAVLLCAAVSGTWLWLIRDQEDLAHDLDLEDWSLPFKKWSGVTEWPNCYLKIPGMGEDEE